MIEKEIVDRVPEYPGRVRLTPVSDNPDVFTMARADEPLVDGTPLDKAAFDSVIQSRLTGRFYELGGYYISVDGYTDEVYDGEFELTGNVASEWTKGQRIMVQLPEAEATYNVVINHMNGIKINTILQSGRRYELVYNGTSFDAREV